MYILIKNDIINNINFVDIDYEDGEENYFDKVDFQYLLQDSGNFRLYFVIFVLYGQDVEFYFFFSFGKML